MTDEVWDLWFPGGGATGLPFCRARVAGDAGDVVLVHAAPPRLDVTVRGEAGDVLASTAGLARTAPGPMTVLRRDGDRVELQDRWPGQEDLGRLVLLPGGEAGVLTAWWHAEDHSAWRWSVEFSNHR